MRQVIWQVALTLEPIPLEMLPMKKITIAIFFIVFTLGLSINSSRANAQLLEFSAQECPVLIIKGINLDVKVSEVSGNQIKISGIANKNQWSFKNLMGKGLLLEEVVKEGRKEIGTHLDQPKLKLVVQVPSVALEVFGYKVDVMAENLKKDVKVVASQGTLKFIKTSGELSLSLNSGDVFVDSHSGKLKLDGEQLKTVVKNANADGEYRVQSLKLDIEKTNGHQQVSAYTGALNLNQNTGTYTIDLSKGSLSSIANQGRLEAFMDEANTEVRLVKDNELNIKTKTGKVFVNTNGVSGVWLNLKSSEGDVYLPAPLRPVKFKTENSFKGRTSGEKTLTRAEIKTNNASIIIK